MMALNFGKHLIKIIGMCYERFFCLAFAVWAGRTTFRADTSPHDIYNISLVLIRMMKMDRFSCEGILFGRTHFCLHCIWNERMAVGRFESVAICASTI